MESATTHVSRTAAAITRLRDSVLVKLLVIGFLTLGLLIPLAMVSSLVRERQGRQRQAEAEISRSWGQPQTLVGPFLSVPYSRTRTQNGVLTWRDEEAVLLPSSLKVEAVLEPETRHLGIFEVIVYRTRIHLKGSFEAPERSLEALVDQGLDWSRASLVLGVPDLRGVQNGLEIAWNGEGFPLEPGTAGSRLVGSGLHLPLGEIAGVEERGDGSFELELQLSGSRELRVAPVGRQSTVTMTSSWPDPGFTGSFLPVRREVTDQGFSAGWEVSYLGRGYPEGWSSHQDSEGLRRRAVTESAVGVELIDLVTGYRKTERSTKYGILFMVVTFGTFFLFEVFRPTALHPMHYLLVGFALCLFYLLLLSLSEYLPFALAYGLSTAAVVGLVAGYSRSVLGDRGRGLLTAVVLAGLYGYLFVLLQIRDYALLLGSLGLFAILTTFMYLTRSVNWHDLRLGRRTPETAPQTPEF